MGYLCLHDYKSLIQLDSLTQIIGSDSTLLTHAESSALKEVTSYLTHKYDLAQEFTNTAVYSYGVTHYAKDRVYLDATAYSASLTYALHSLTLYQGSVYINNTAITVPEAWNISNWDILGAQYTYFNVIVPNPEWNYYTDYVTGDIVWFGNKNYTAVTANNGLQPDENSATWGAGVAYSLAGTVLPTDDTKWASGDNRNTQILDYVIDVALYHLHSRIAPRNIPDLRVKRYDDAIRWLKEVSKGNFVTAAIPVFQPNQGLSTVWGNPSTFTRSNNNY